MNPKLPKRKRRYLPKDWDRRARVQEALCEKRLTQGQLGEKIKLANSGFLSSLIWGTQRSFTWETRIAVALGRAWEDLFAPDEPGKRRAA